MRKLIIGFIIGALLFGIVPVMADSGLTIKPNPFPVIIDGAIAEVEGYNINGYTFLKLADFRKAGLTIEFNDTEKQIEIATAGESLAVATGKGDEAVGDIERYEENGYKAIRKNGAIYYELYSILGSAAGLYQKGYSFRYNPNTKKCSLTYNRDYPAMAIDKAVTIIEDVPCIVFEGSTYTSKDFYLNTILPETEKPHPKPK